MIKRSIEKLKYLIPVVVTFSIMFVVMYYPLTFYSSLQNPHIVDAASPYVGQQMFIFLWQYRGLDLIVQSLFLFTAVVSCITLLRVERKK